MIILLQVTASFCVLFPVHVTKTKNDDIGILFNWQKYKDFHGKEYAGYLDQLKRKIYMQNSEKIAHHNKLFEQGLKSFKMAMNQFGDPELHEFTKLMNGFRKNYNGTKASKRAVFLNLKFMVPPDELDWRQHGYVTPVKDQGQCGSCWAFSATGSLEGQHFKKTGELVPLSEQQLIDCSSQFGNMGCIGGSVNRAFDYIKDNHGLDKEMAYPYEGIENECRFEEDAISATVIRYVDVPFGDEDKLEEALAAVGPISVTIDASHDSFQFYKSGVLDEKDCSSEELDHAVLVVGYGNDNGKDYWLVKNSWGDQWGDGGYIKMVRNKQNQCGIATHASYPLV